jgi:hypothetical protein
MRRLFLAAALLLLRLWPAFSQEDGGGDGGLSSYLMPPNIYVGDLGKLITPLGLAYMAAAPFVYTTPDKLPRGENIVISKIELEHRNGSARLIIDFIPYAPGTVDFPPLVIPIPGAEPLTVTGLSAQVVSILGSQEASLSEPAAPLAVPGTAVIIYGSAAAILVVLLAAAGIGIWGRKHFSVYRRRIRRRRLLRAMDRYLRRLAAESGAAGLSCRKELLSQLSGEFREFLSLFTGVNCRVLTPSEFGGVNVLENGLEKEQTSISCLLSGTYLCDFFRRWENVRFSGKRIGQGDLSAVLDEVKGFIGSLSRAEKEAS